MDNLQKLKDSIEQGYNFSGDSLVLGSAMLGEDQVAQGAYIKAPLKMLNRHGLIAGATGTGKTKTIQLLAEEMATKGISVLLMDLKGDLSGLASAGTDNDAIQDRHEKIGIPYAVQKFPVEFLSLSQEKGARLRATVTEFGPILFSKILELNDNQSGIVSLIFKYSDDNGLPLLDLKDFKQVIQHITNEGKEAVEKEYGAVSTASTGTILRKIIELEQQGANLFFGETSFDPEDLMRQDAYGNGLISVLRLTDMQDRPKLFSTFMLSLLAEIYATFPEQGDADRPKLCIFIDESHLIFKNATKALLDQIESIVKLIRSKGVGLFFATQNPTDIPDAILSQLGFKAQHALRAFTAKDRKEIKLTAQNYPDSEFYDTAEMLTSLGIGEAAITVLDEKGRPTPLAHTMLRAPRTRMGILNDNELDAIVGSSRLVAKYNETIDRESAYEMLIERLANEEKAAEEAAKNQNNDNNNTPNKPSSPRDEKEEGMFESLTKNTAVRQMGRTVFRELTRGLLGALTGRRTTRRRRW